MKKIIIGISVVLIVCGLFAYRYFYLPKKIEDNFTAKLVIKNTPEKVEVQSEAKRTEEKSAANKKEVDSIPIAAKKGTPAQKKKSNLLKNGKFGDGMKGWHLWQNAKNTPGNIKVVEVDNNNHFSSALRIENPDKKLLGISQVATLTSGAVYRLSASVRSLGNDKSKIFGGRIAIYLPPQKEKQIVWMSEYNHWWKKELIFTNQVSGIATVYVHMGYGGVASTGEFTNISLEKIK
jgi:uncharacterized protein YxeA